MCVSELKIDNSGNMNYTLFLNNVLMILFLITERVAHKDLHHNENYFPDLQI